MVHQRGMARDMSNVLDRFRLDGKVALVTGGAKGLGAVFSAALASAGARVALTSRDLGQAEGQAEAIRGEGGESLAIAADVSRAGDVSSMVAKVLDRYG